MGGGLHRGVRLRRSRAAMVGLVVAVVAGAARPAVADDQGAAVDLGRIEVAEPLRAGQRYVLPTLRVRNPGTVPTEYHMTARAVAGSSPELTAGWVTFSPATFSLSPEERQPVEVVLHLADDAASGDYDALLAAQAVAAGDGNRVAAAAASRLTFTVKTSTPADGTPTWIWLALAAAALVAGQALWRLRSRYQVRLVRR